MYHIQRMSFYLIIILNLLLVLLPSLALGQWVLIDWPFVNKLIVKGMWLSSIQTPEGIVEFADAKWDLFSKIIGCVGSSIGLLPIFFSIFILKELFRNYKSGKIFTYRNACYYRSLGWMFFLHGLVTKPLSGLLLVLAATVSNPPNHRYISITFGVPNIEAIFCGTLVIVISWVIAEGCKLHEENHLTI
jgi:hypothetical protein